MKLPQFVDTNQEVSIAVLRPNSPGFSEWDEVIEGAVDVREELRQLTAPCPNGSGILVQHFFTSMTGKPYKGQEPLFEATPVYQLLTALASLLFGVATSTILCNSAPVFYPLLVVSWGFTVGGARKIQTNLCHRLIHHQFFGDWRDRWLAEILSTFLLIQDFEGYAKDHVALHHHRDKFSTLEDPDKKLLLKLGFVPGLTDNAKR